jgi:membrane protein involved in colicin uptake
MRAPLAELAKAAPPSVGSGARLEARLEAPLLMDETAAEALDWTAEAAEDAEAWMEEAAPEAEAEDTEAMAELADAMRLEAALGTTAELTALAAEETASDWAKATVARAATTANFMVIGRVLVRARVSCLEDFLGGMASGTRRPSGQLASRLASNARPDLPERTSYTLTPGQPSPGIP